MAHHPIRVDNSEPVTAQDTARTLRVSRKRTEELIRTVRRMLQRDAKTGNVLIRSTESGKSTVRSGNGNAKTEKTVPRRRRVSR